MIMSQPMEYLQHVPPSTSISITVIAIFYDPLHWMNGHDFQVGLSSYRADGAQRIDYFAPAILTADGCILLQ